MRGEQLREARLISSCTQNDAAKRLGITQAYLSMVERGARPVSAELASKALEVFELPATALPLGEYRHRSRCAGWFQEALGALGYPGFAYLHGSAKINPAELLMAAIDSDDLDSRVVEALPWIPVSFPKMEWPWLVRNSRLLDRQNRLAYLVILGAQIAGRKNQPAVEKTLRERVAELEPSRLAAEDTLCKVSLTQAERKWLQTHRSPVAKHWNLLTDLSVDHLDHAFF